MYNAKQVVPFKTMSMPCFSHTSALKYYGALAFGCNVFLQCHTAMGNPEKKLKPVFTSGGGQNVIQGKSLWNK